MRIIVSGAHASGKSTLISDFTARYPHFTVLTDPFESMDEADDAPRAAMFAAQLRITAERLTEDSLAADVIAERGPMDFLAYLLALADLTGRAADADVLRRALARTTEAMRAVDLLIVLPLTAADEIHVSAEEHLALREAMNDVLLELVDDPDIVGRTRVVELTGSPAQRLQMLEAVLAPKG
ncbi:adenylate kinase family enzyme [Microbacterium sp. SORGH_AS428]|uniref:AAA family ATPase n=1 Tax=Microbacterium sp. SORGH_AS_0428 TaxID=3041788 RepID=UPI0028676C8E|nr:AAA family ATPase [Microbacterium sp. SORGH_AS_0428]MDR6198144.1 adenylate kinase family enzyme [Microbacterium sp. SORGH_AS_0428]